MNVDTRALSDVALDRTRIAAALALSSEAHWNQTAEDWRMLLQLGQGFGLVNGKGELVATAVALPFTGHCAWISMVLVTSAWQRRGLATRLMQRAIETIESHGRIPMLDATPAGRAVYRELGFIDGWSFARWSAAKPAVPDITAMAAWPAGTKLRPISAGDWEGIDALDQDVLGAARPHLLRELAQRLPQAAWAAERNGKLQGFLLGRNGRNANQLGPLAASDDATACALLAAGLGATSGPVYVDALDSHPGLIDLLRQAGFVQQRPFTRMARPPAGEAASFGNPARYYAVAGPELA